MDDMEVAEIEDGFSGPTAWGGMSQLVDHTSSYKNAHGKKCIFNK